MTEEKRLRARLAFDRITRLVEEYTDVTELLGVLTTTWPEIKEWVEDLGRHARKES